MKHIFETRLTIDETAGPIPGFEVVAEAGCHYRGYKINGPESAQRLCTDALVPYFVNKRDQEEMHVIALDTKHKPLKIVRVTRGTLDASLVHPREIFRPALWCSASAVLLVHNHPSGETKPSKEDIHVTERMERAGETVGISVLDHIILTHEDSLSIKAYQHIGGR